MNDREQAQLTLIATHSLATGKKAVGERIKRVFADHAAKHLLHSGATVKVSVRAMHEIADDLLTELGPKAQAVAADKEAFGLMSSAVTDFLDYCAESHLPTVVKMASGRPQGVPDVSIVRAAEALFNDVRADIAAKLMILAFDFDEPPVPPTLASADQPTISATRPVKKGGRPPAEFWDDMWAAIAFALYNGDIVPKSQADVERAMMEWIESNGRSAAPSTVRARARRLWDRLAASED